MKTKYVIYALCLPVCAGCDVYTQPSVQAKVSRVHYDFKVFSGQLDHDGSGLELNDPFGRSYKIVKSNECSIIYSVGPDEVDNGGVLVYDPSNGTVSAGDITMQFRFLPVSSNAEYVEETETNKQGVESGLLKNPILFLAIINPCSTTPATVQ